ncbi:cutinase family protein [uncultured Microbacterium sp.]|uniref:cutinase family protein n=1 Tax=uncultured Microbacterium sp. TaxID=191216 RepID=UPI0037DDB004
MTLVGYSQGADVIGTALGESLGNNARAYVQGAVLFGDPSYRPNQPINAPGLNPQGSGMFSLSRSDAIQATLNDMRSYGWNSDTGSLGWRQHVREYCNEGDAACQNNVASGWGVHGHYGKWTQDAAFFLNNFIIPPG